MDDRRSSSKFVNLPVGRVNTIMKSSSDVENVSKESSVIMSKAAELFIRTLTEEGYVETHFGKRLDYKSLANIVHRNDKYNFLRDILPKKITVLQFKEIMAKKKAAKDKSEGEDSSSVDEEESSDGEESGSSTSGN
ncbi:chromatin accessibility complex 16kD protein [Euwallacea similis]|uniref:chromatin accessibility complex 16kD protein n=1 Tax=Euwallacea similis TaxID=1736056 RepID=UPI00344E9BDC